MANISKKEPYVQRGIWNLLFNKMNYSMEYIQSILTAYAEKCLDRKKPRRNRLKFYMEISTHAQQNFDDFMKFLKENYKNRYAGAVESYDDWYERASMDGSLAYSGVADDF